MSEVQIYHERQYLSLCALHTLNNLFQDSIFNKSNLDEICENLNENVWFNPHRNIFGLGNYDINVIMSALETRDHSMNWFDKRKKVTEIILKNVFGFILNCQSSFNFGLMQLPSPQKHWFAIRLINNSYYNLDSKLSKPVKLGGEDKLLDFLQTQLSKSTTNLFVVINNSISQTWMMQKDLEN